MGVAAAILAGLPSDRASGTSPCDRYASPAGSDRALGGEHRPFRTVGRLARSLRPGQTGCLARGTYREDVTLRRGGLPGVPLTLRSRPGHAARILGHVVVARTADHVVLRQLWFDGAGAHGLPSPIVTATGVVIQENDIVNRRGICLVLGSTTFGRAIDTLVERNRIHHCGRLPATNHDHGIYVEASDRAIITGNWIHHNADRGIQLYPDAQDTRIVGNVIHRNGQGVIFSGEGGLASSGTVVEGNVISGSLLRANVESFWPPGNPVGGGNVVRGNCLFGAAWYARSGGVQSPQTGFQLAANLVANPRFVRPRRGDLRLKPGSRCHSLFGGPASRPGPAHRPPRSRKSSS